MAGEIQGVQLNFGAGGVFRNPPSEDTNEYDNDHIRFNATAGVTLTLGGDPVEFEGTVEPAIKAWGLPLNVHVDRWGPGLWAVGGDAAVRWDNFMVLLDLGVKGDALMGHDEEAFGLTLFGRLGMCGDVGNLEVGKLVYSGHPLIPEEGVYALLSVNLLLIAVGGRHGESSGLIRGKGLWKAEEK